MHRHFRLFSTQNPGNGSFGKFRDSLPKSLLQRFTPFIVDTPTRDEQQLIVSDKLVKSLGLADAKAKECAKTMVDVHHALARLVQPEPPAEPEGKSDRKSEELPEFGERHQP